MIRKPLHLNPRVNLNNDNIKWHKDFLGKPVCHQRADAKVMHDGDYNTLIIYSLHLTLGECTLFVSLPSRCCSISGFGRHLRLTDPFNLDFEHEVSITLA